jgi:hypothetical protein
VNLLQRELGNASRELNFIRTADLGLPEPTVAALPLPVPQSSGRPSSASAPLASGVSGAPTYQGFSAVRYNSTIDQLKERRPRLAIWSLALASLISLALVALAIAAHEPTPALGLAVFPSIWMLPVPFFVLSFFGTQRVLRRNHLNVAGDP